MKDPSPAPATVVAETHSARFLAGVLLAGAVLAPLAISFRGIQTFRLPNQLVMVAAAIVVTAVGVASILWNPTNFRLSWRRMRVVTTLAGAGVLWTVVVTAFSLTPSLSLKAWPFVFSAIAIAVASAWSLRFASVAAVAIATAVPAVINVAAVSLQASGLWHPWVFDTESTRMQKSALLGNPNDVGAYLLAPLILMTVLAMAAPRFRMLYSVVGVACAAGIILSETLTSIVSGLAAVSLVVILRYRRRGILLIAAAVAAISVAILAYQPLRERVAGKVALAAANDADRLLSGRVPAFLTAWAMFREQPVTGVGPGIFKQEFMTYRIAITPQRGEFFWMLYAPIDGYFREVHNDHLQLLAEGGLPALLLMFAAFATAGSVSFRSDHRSNSRIDARATTARLLAFPLIAGLFIAMLAGFPLQLASAVYTFALLGGACIAWGQLEESA